ncbi:hypothetical protein ASPZODRAFT_320187 [Penicilliopsis zonata CBS 506.65]|uniref:Uncharacterized protein n=1 Tax=Penicilliopsis zonata CBS 506.65 TaxID=1073090 RepID=A0A1L9SVA2_9EURO|nr:hypothetical protein ASPZODRAFT_320187 [Penicilliopsis zonata CBS 506.65]OJJ51119.1 hypothetical protein ASPZODRAFT_320187 [Penicilliopsis zonata CBS 506.65]
MLSTCLSGSIDVCSCLLTGCEAVKAESPRQVRSTPGLRPTLPSLHSKCNTPQWVCCGDKQTGRGGCCILPLLLNILWRLGTGCLVFCCAGGVWRT